MQTVFGVNSHSSGALKILLPPPHWWGLETDWHEFPNCTICWERQSG